MAVAKTVSTILNGVSVTAGGNVVSQGVDLSAAIDFSLGFVVIFPTGATGNLKFELFGDPTGASQDFTVGTYDDSVDEGEVPYTAAQTVRGVYPMVKAPKYVKVKVTNLGAVDISSVSLYAIIQVA